MRILAAAAKPPRTTRCFPAPYHLSTTTTTSTSSSQHCSSYDPTAQFLPSHSHHHRLLSHALTSPSPHPVRFAAASRLAASSPALRPFASILLAALLPGASPDLLAWCGSRGGSGRYAALHAFLAAGMASEAFDVLARVRRGGKTPSLSALASLLRLLFRGGEVRTAWKVFEEMAARGPRPSLATFNAMILGFCHRGLVRVGAGLLAVMGRFRIVPDEMGFLIKESLQKSQSATDAVVSILSSFDSRLSALDAAMRPIQVRTHAVRTARRPDAALGGCDPNPVRSNSRVNSKAALPGVQKGRWNRF